MRIQNWLLFAAKLMFLVTMTGCPGNGTVSSTGDCASGAASPDDLLQNAIYQLNPENFSIAASPDKPVTLLNSWHDLVIESKNAKEASAFPELPKGWVDDNEIARLKVPTFDPKDAIHIRDSLLNREIATYLAARSKDELQKVQIVFDFVIRNVTLPGKDDPDLPLGSYQALLLGRGTPTDRAWICASILRQLRIDSVIVRPEADTDQNDSDWLLGVVLNKRVYLFDTRMGIAIPSTADPASTQSTPATLDEIPTHPEWLKSLAPRADQSYGVDAESLVSPRIYAMTKPILWTHRMKHLELALPANENCVLYDPLVDDMGQTGLLTRLLEEVPGCKLEQLKPWTYLRDRSSATQKLSPAAAQQWELTKRVFSVPIPMEADEETKTITFGAPENRMLRIRTEQLQGKFDDATAHYLSIQHLEFEQVPIPEIQILYQRAAQDANYWTGVCKFELGEFQAAKERLATYLKQYERDGHWIHPARALLAECHAALGQFQSAAAVLEQSTDRDDPYREGNAVRAKRWNARHAKPSQDEGK